jgi:hypothetical protein
VGGRYEIPRRTPVEFVVVDGVVFGDVIILILVVKCKELLSDGDADAV